MHPNARRAGWAVKQGGAPDLPVTRSDRSTAALLHTHLPGQWGDRDRLGERSYWVGQRSRPCRLPGPQWTVREFQLSSGAVRTWMQERHGGEWSKPCKNCKRLCQRRIHVGSSSVLRIDQDRGPQAGIRCVSFGSLAYATDHRLTFVSMFQRVRLAARTWPFSARRTRSEGSAPCFHGHARIGGSPPDRSVYSSTTESAVGSMKKALDSSITLLQQFAVVTLRCGHAHVRTSRASDERRFQRRRRGSKSIRYLYKTSAAICAGSRLKRYRVYVQDRGETRFDRAHGHSDSR